MLYIVLGIAIFWIITANILHEKLGYNWKSSFLLAPILLIYFLFSDNKSE